jgi:hypothetical protein
LVIPTNQKINDLQQRNKISNVLLQTKLCM